MNNLRCAYCGKNIRKVIRQKTIVDRGSQQEGFQELLTLAFCSDKCYRAWEKYRRIVHPTFKEIQEAIDRIQTLQV